MLASSQAQRALCVEWSYKGEPVRGFEQLLARYGAKEFASPSRSTVPLLAFWHRVARRLAELWPRWELPASDAIRLDFEHETPVLYGRGRASCTDLMLISEAGAVAIEAKFAEPRYPDVATWLGSAASRNRQAVLGGWLEMLNRGAARRVQLADVVGLPYQMVHRAASACGMEARNCRLMYQVFDATPQKQDMYLRDLEALRDLLGADSRLRIGLVLCKVQPAARLAELQRSWNKGERDLSVAVVAGLKSGDLCHPTLDDVLLL